MAIAHLKGGTEPHIQISSLGGVMTTQVVAAGQERGAERSNKLKLAPLIALGVGSR